MESLLRREIISLRPYEAQVIEGNVKMDANENPFPWPEGMREELFSQKFEFNRYPDGMAEELRKAIARYNGVKPEQVLVGNGSDELIQIILNTFGGRGRAVMIHPPTFSMYAAAALITGTALVEVPLIEGVRLDLENILCQCSANPEIKVIIVCNPNNPTGALFPEEDILRLVKATNALVVVDEAYAEFSGVTLLEKINSYPNMLVLRTFSKAFGMAALRLGYVMARKELIGYLNRVRQPFNVNSFSQKAGVIALKYVDEYKKQIETIKKEIQMLYNELNSFPEIKVLPTKANFLLFQPEDPDKWAEELSRLRFTVRNLGELPGLGRCLRMSSGTPEENRRFLEAVKKISQRQE